MKPVVADVMRYEGTNVPKQVRIRVLSRFAKPKEDVADLYKRTLRAEKLPWDESTHGSIEWDATAAQLSITVGPGKPYRLGRVRELAKNPPERWHSFPPPRLIEEIYPTLLGSTYKRTRRGYAYALGRQGRPETKAKSAENAILACAAWYVGERDQEIKPKDRRPRIARMLNRHLLGPMERPPLFEDHWKPNWDPKNAVWRDARELSDDLRRAWYFLQYTELL